MANTPHTDTTPTRFKEWHNRAVRLSSRVPVFGRTADVAAAEVEAHFEDVYREYLLRELLLATTYQR
jgi:hypothetical protein